MLGKSTKITASNGKVSNLIEYLIKNLKKKKVDSLKFNQNLENLNPFYHNNNLSIPNFQQNLPPFYPQNIPQVNNGSNNPFFLPPINQNIRISRDTLDRKKKEELVYKALEKQTDLLNDIAKRFKGQAEDEQKKMLKKIKELEEEREEILFQRKNEDIIQLKVFES